MPEPVRVLLIADTHIGLDLPVRPRVARRRRGEDFLANFARALEPARDGEVDLVVHGGDVFDRPRVHPEVARCALRPLLEVAQRGIPIFVVPGNHERARLPGSFSGHPGVHVFDRPRTFTVEVGGRRVGLAGFPYERSIRARFPEVLRRTGLGAERCDAALLCMHHCVEGATVGPGDFTFTRAPDVIRGRDIPSRIAAVMSGHIHRRQVLLADLGGRRLAAPVLYPGSVERTSAAEIGEEKGYFIVRLEADGTVCWEARPLPARPMLVRELDVTGLGASAVQTRLRAIIGAAPRAAVLRIRVTGEPGPDALAVLAAARVRALAPVTMNVELQHPAARRRPRVAPSAAPPRSPQLDLGLHAGG